MTSETGVTGTPAAESAPAVDPEDTMERSPSSAALVAAAAVTALPRARRRVYYLYDATRADGTALARFTNARDARRGADAFESLGGRVEMRSREEAGGVRPAGSWFVEYVTRSR